MMTLWFNLLCNNLHLYGNMWHIVSWLYQSLGGQQSNKIFFGNIMQLKNVRAAGWAPSVTHTLITPGKWYVVTDQSFHFVLTNMIIDFAFYIVMIWSYQRCSYGSFERTPEGSITLFRANRYFSSEGFGRVYPCALELQAVSFHALFRSLYLCRAARGSADIPILPHAHTILLKHAVNLKRERTLFTSKRLFHHLIVLLTSRCHTNIGFPQNSGA